MSRIKNIAIVAPHLDDGVLSCGELIHKHAELGNNVTVITVFTGYPNANELTPAAKLFHSMCFLSHDSMEYRKKEDIAANDFLGSSHIHLDFYECLYRKDTNGNNIYTDLFDIYHLEDDINGEYVSAIKTKLFSIINQYDIILAPLGIGEHADHLLINKIMREFASCAHFKEVLFYEEVPYLCDMYNENTDIECPSMVPVFFEVSKTNFEKKIEAILFYRSQLNVLWKNREKMEKELYTISTMHGNGHCLRLWKQDLNSRYRNDKKQ